MLGTRFFINKLAANAPNILCQQTRNTFILKRREPPPLHRKGGRPKKMKARHFIYDLVQDTNMLARPDMKVILTQFVEGVGNPGDAVNLRPSKAYQELLLPGLAVYASPENLEKYKVTDSESKPKEEHLHSSPFVPRTMGCLSRLTLGITMNKFQPWTLEPWHIRVAFRKTGYIVPEHAIEMPPGQISGPDLSLQNKEFYITVTINKTEKVNVRCRIHHWATGLDRIPWEENHWLKPKEPLFPEQAEVLEKMSLAKDDVITIK